MCSGDADDFAPARHVSERVSPSHDGNATAPRPLKLRMILRHRRRDDERADPLDMTRIVRPDVDPESPQIGGAVGVGITPSDADAATHEQLGERAHAGAGDAHEMDRTRIGGIQKLHGRRNIAKTTRKSGNPEAKTPVEILEIDPGERPQTAHFTLLHQRLRVGTVIAREAKDPLSHQPPYPLRDFRGRVRACSRSRAGGESLEPRRIRE